MKLVYIIGNHTTATSSYRLHIPNHLNYNYPICGAKSFTIEFAEGDKPTCKRCLKMIQGDKR